MNGQLGNRRGQTCDFGTQCVVAVVQGIGVAGARRLTRGGQREGAAARTKGHQLEGVTECGPESVGEADFEQAGDGVAGQGRGRRARQLPNDGDRAAEIDRDVVGVGRQRPARPASGPNRPRSRCRAWPT
jgi:hypothetical protein